MAVLRNCFIVEENPMILEQGKTNLDIAKELRQIPLIRESTIGVGLMTRFFKNFFNCLPNLPRCQKYEWTFKSPCRLLKTEALDIVSEDFSLSYLNPSCSSPTLKMLNEDSRLNLAHQNLRNVPKTLINSFQDRVKIIDLSNNSINDVSFLKSFSCLSCIILDHNEISTDIVFPYLPKVQILWLNHNQIVNIGEFVKNLSSSFPSLRQLSLMGNPGVPPCHEDTYYDYLRYRLFIIYCFPSLEHLDDRPVTSHEKEEAVRLFGTPLLDKLSSITGALYVAVSKVRQYISSPTVDRPNVPL